MGSYAHQSIVNNCSSNIVTYSCNMPWPSCSPSNVVEVVFCRTKCNKMAVIHQDFYFHHNRKYKGGDYWCCAQRGCKVRLISSVNHETGQLQFSRRNKAIQHHHPTNAPNLFEKDFRRELISQFDKMISSETGTTQLATAKLVEQVYYKVEREALDRGVPKSLIPSIGNMRSTLYRIRKKYDLLQVSNMDDIDDGIMHESLHLDNNATSAGEGSTSPSSSSESLSSVNEPSTIPEQTEPLCLVTWKKKDHQPKEEHPDIPELVRHASPILYQTLQCPVPSTLPSLQEPLLHHMTSIPVNPNLLRYPNNFPPSYYSPIPHDQSQILQHYAALHAEYVRSLIELNFYPHM